MICDSGFRSLLKTLSWRISGTIVTILLTFQITKNKNMALTIGCLDVFLKSFFYFFHERLWEKIHIGKYIQEAPVLWFTGFSGAGKTTLANNICKIFAAQGHKVEHLDGDEIRQIFPHIGFSQEERNQHLKRMGHLANRLAKNGIWVIASFISPYEESRQFIGSICKNYFEIYLSTPLEICAGRDVKGLYRKAKQGDIVQFTGLTDPYEIPEHPNLILDTSTMTVSVATEKILVSLKTYLKRKNKKPSNIRTFYETIKNIRKQKHIHYPGSLQRI